MPPSSPVQLQGPGEFVLGLFGQGGKTTAFMVVNRNYRTDATANLKVEIPGERLCEFDRQTGKWIECKKLETDRVVKVRLRAGDGRLFRLGL